MITINSFGQGMAEGRICALAERLFKITSNYITWTGSSILEIGLASVCYLSERFGEGKRGTSADIISII